MNAKRTAIALGIVGLLAAAATTRAELVYSENFDSYTNGSSLGGQGGWINPGYGNMKVYNPSGNGAAELGTAGGWAVHVLPTSFAFLNTGDTNVITYDLYQDVSANAWLASLAVTSSAYEPISGGANANYGIINCIDNGAAGIANYLFEYNNTGGLKNYLVSKPGSFFISEGVRHNLSLSVTRTASNTVQWTITMDGTATASINKNYDTTNGVDLLGLFVYDNGGTPTKHILVDNIKVYDSTHRNPPRGLVLQICMRQRVEGVVPRQCAGGTCEVLGMDGHRNTDVSVRPSPSG